MARTQAPAVIEDSGIYRFEDHGEKDAWGRKVYRCYWSEAFGGAFRGYRYRRSERDKEAYRRRYYAGNRIVIINTWADAVWTDVIGGIPDVREQMRVVDVCADTAAD